MNLLTDVKAALRITTCAFDNELRMLIDAAKLDLGLAGVNALADNSLINRAIITYCRANFGTPADYDRIKASYDEQKSQLLMATGYRAEG